MNNDMHNYGQHGGGGGGPSLYSYPPAAAATVNPYMAVNINLILL